MTWHPVLAEHTRGKAIIVLKAAAAPRLLEATAETCRLV